MDLQLKIMVLGSLLHDIGKLAQRAKRPFSKEMENEYLTNYNGKPGHWHTLYSDYFIEKDLPLPHELESHRSRIARTASAHHRPSSDSLSELSLMIADRLSSGTDRIKENQTESAPGFRQSRLVSIFDEIEMLNHTFNPPGRAFYQLRPLESDSDCVFPVFGDPRGPSDDYDLLFNQFMTAIHKLSLHQDYRFYLDSLISILEKYTWCIPSSSFKTLSDVSLFDHSYSTASIGQSLFCYHREKNTLPSFDDKEKKFILMGGDLSGIQNYIFGISRNSGRGVSKIFRARSFFLQVLVRSVLIEIGKRLDLTPVFRLMDSGGKFILLLPGIDSVIKHLESFNEKIQWWFRKKFKGGLTLSLTWETKLSHEDFRLTNFQHKLDEVHASLDTSKLKKLKATFSQSGPVIHSDFSETDTFCSLCKINISDSRASKDYLQEGIEIPICTDCYDQITYIGKELPTSNYIIYRKNGKIPLFGDIKMDLSKSVPSDLNDIFCVDSMIDSESYARIRMARHLPKITLDELQDANWYDLLSQEYDQDTQGNKAIYTLEPDVPKTFSMIAKKSKRKYGGKLVGRELLTFMKADVDNLGLIFSLGLGDRLSIARFSTLSRMLNLFFSEYLTNLIQKEYPDIYVVFAGGDDLFLIGPWWQSIRFAMALREKFHLFCAKNTDITLSAGLFVSKPRLPMRKAADVVEQHLETAKKQESDDRLKDTVFIIGETLSWSEMEELIVLGEQFDRAVREKDRTGFSNAFLYRLLTYHKMYRKFISPDHKNITYGRYLALAHYDIGRNIKTKKGDNETEIKLLNRIFSVGVQHRPELEQLNVPLFYAVNLNR
jgi:CRISPR-associated protein Csm1